MKRLNLSSLENSDIKYKISQFPDGQQDIVITEEKLLLQGNNYSPGINIRSRFNSFRDLELIICATKALKRLGVKEIHLYIPYLLGARSDRHFQEGGNSYLVDIIAPIINAQDFESVTVLDVHSDVAAACIKNLKVESNRRLVLWALNDIAKDGTSELIALSPDAGAQKKIYKVTEDFKIITDVVTASKQRDIYGKLTKTVVPDIPLNKDLVVIDDICDGGRTFNNIIAALDSERSGKNYLIVTHGIFSAGYDDLFKYFDAIYTTNSVKDIGGLDGNSNKRINVKQMKVI